MGLCHLLVACLGLTLLITSTDAQVTAWTEPAIAGNKDGSAIATKNIASHIAGTSQDVATGVVVVAAGADAAAAGYVVTTQPSGVTGTMFAADATTAGQINLKPGFAITAASYVIVVEATSTGNNVGTATVTMSVNNAPAFGAELYSWCPAAGLAAATSVGTLSATDADTGNTITLALAGGNTNTDFTYTVGTGALVTANALGSTGGRYTLLFTAVDNGDVIATGSTAVLVEIGGGCGALSPLSLSGTAALTASLLAILCSMLFALV